MKHKGLLAAGLGVLLLAPLAIFVAMRWSDIPPPDDSDLKLPDRKTDPARNPYPSIRSFRIEAAEKDAIGRAWKMYRGEGEESFDTGFIAGLLEKHSEALARFDRYAAMTDWRQDQVMAVDTEVHYLNSWLVIARLKVLQSQKAVREKRVGDALMAGISNLRFARGLHLAEGGFIHQVVAASIARLGIASLLDTVDSGQLSAEQLALLDRVLANPIYSMETMSQAFIVESVVYRKVADDLAEGKIHVHQLRTAEADSGPAHPPGRFFYKRNTTVKLLADSFRQFIRESSMIRSEAPEEPIGVAGEFRDNAGGLYLSGNLIGRILFSIVVPSGKSLSDRFSATLVRLDLLRVRVAMERYRLENGDWPETIGGLVPEFLDGIPVDRMDGRPIRFSKQKRLIYSVGLDFVDDGGKAPDDSGILGSDEEIVIELPVLPAGEG